MATTVHVSHTRELSVTRLECDINPNFSFPVQGHTRSQSLLPPSTFGPSNSPVRPFAYPPRRGSVPPSSGGPLASASVNTNRPKSSSASSSLSSKPLSDSSPYHPSGTRAGSRTIANGAAPKIVNASVTREIHQRTGSEMIGGPPLVAVKKEDSLVATIERVVVRPIVPTPPSGVRRGHAHRRSGAISSGDVWSLLSQSAPSLPLGCVGNQGIVDTSLQPKGSAGTSPILSKSAPVSPGFTAISPLPSPSMPIDSLSEDGDRKGRVHFIDHAKVIPADAEISSTTAVVADTVDATVVKASIAALPPLVTSPTIATAALGRRPHGRTRSNSQTLNLPTAALRATSDRPSDRPSTAGAVLASPVFKTMTDEEAFPSVPSAGLTSEKPPTKPLPQKKMHKKALSDDSPLVGTGSFTAITGKGLSGPDGQSSEQTNKKKKKKSKKQIKNWAGTILSKGKLRHGSKRQFKALPRRSPTPPPRSENQMPRDNEWIPAAWNENYVLMAVDDSLGPNSSTESVVIAADAAESPIIDLDAALGPFNTPIGPNAGFAAARRRRMHSAVGLKANGYFHRRSESMPEMQLFSLEEDEYNGHMDDVFEEEESEDSESEDEEGKMEGLGIGVKIVDEDVINWQEGIQMEWGFEKTNSDRNMGRRMSAPDSGESWRAHRASLSVTTTLKGPRRSTSIKSKSSIGDEDEEITPVSPRKEAPADIITSSHSSGSTITTGQFLYPQVPDSPTSFVTATSNPITPIMLEFSADDYTGSATSFDLYSDFLGEPGPEMRMSVDDVPSLTSSSSIMTMNGAYYGMPSTPGVGSLGSLDMHVKEGKKEGKSKRWSKIFSFWKSK